LGAISVSESLEPKAGVAPVRRADRTAAILTACSLIFGLAVLPVAYYAGFYLGDDFLGRPFDLWRHIGVVSGANTFVMVAASRAGGRLDRQIGASLVSVVMAHGVVAFMTLGFRFYYSNQLMLVGVLTSTIAALAIILLRRRLHTVRAALLGPWHPIAARMRTAYDHLTGAPADLDAYDLVLVTAATPPEGWAGALTEAMMRGKPVRHLAEFIEEERGIVSEEHFHLDHLPTGGLTSYQVRKRALDIGLTLVMAPIALLILALTLPLSLISMGRPVFFVQPRVGLGGKVFRMYKLRTMTVAPVGEQIATVRGDLRVTGLGRWLRRFRIDELPQLWNVLKGDMSLVGPRPEQAALTEAYGTAMPAFLYRSLVRPGITGWAQVHAGYAADLDETRLKLSYDLFYLKNFSLSLDIQVLLRTIVILVTGRGAR
jgi:lipopolysaccharide/colanic/teichoic acid biosynthesis glycosyltransferase